MRTIPFVKRRRAFERLVGSMHTVDFVREGWQISCLADETSVSLDKVLFGVVVKVLASFPNGCNSHRFAIGNPLVLPD